MIQPMHEDVLNIIAMDSQEIKKEFPKLFELFSSPDWKEKIESKLLELAEEYPSFEYNKIQKGPCHYHKGTENGPDCDGCIFGQAFQRLGVPKKELAKIGVTIRFVIIAFDKSCPSEWSDVQSNQDRGMCWKNAIEPIRQS